MTWIAIPAALLVVVSTFVGGIVALRLHRELPTLIALTGGVVLGVALFDVLPEAIDAVDDSARVGTLVGAGFLLFFLAERALVLHHRDEPEQARAHEQVGVLGAAGLSVHSFIDGLGIGLAFGLDTSTGVLVLIAVLAHDFADGLNTVGFILSQSGDRRKALRWLSIDAVAPLLGAIVGASLSVSEHTLGTPARALRRLLPLHGRNRPLARGAPASIAAEGGADCRGLRGDLRGGDARPGLATPSLRARGGRSPGNGHA